MDVDVYEHNEAFASASCAVAQEVEFQKNGSTYMAEQLR